MFDRDIPLLVSESNRLNCIDVLESRDLKIEI